MAEAINQHKKLAMGKSLAMKKGGKVPNFEVSVKDIESKKNGKEGSKKEEAFDKTEMKKGGKVAMKCGGKVKK